MIDIDRFREIIDTLSRNKARSFLTGFGIFWGIFMLVILIGGKQGLEDKLHSNFEGFATNTAVVWAQPTTKPYNGFKKGRTWRLQIKDLKRLKQAIPELNVVTSMISKNNCIAVFKDKNVTCSVKGTDTEYTVVEEPKIYYGRYINQIDVQKKKSVCNW